METVSINKRMLLQQFLLWWMIYFIFICLLIFFMWYAGREKEILLRNILIGAECTALGAVMGVSHYYGFYTRYFIRKKHLTYIILSVGFIALFILLDFILFYFQIGRARFYNDTVGHVLYINLQRVMYAYIPVVLLYMFVRNYQIRKKERKNNAKFVLDF